MDRIDLSRADRLAARLWRASREVSHRMDSAPEQLAAFAERSRKLYDESRPLLGDEIIDLAIKATSK